MYGTLMPPRLPQPPVIPPYPHHASLPTGNRIGILFQGAGRAPVAASRLPGRARTGETPTRPRDAGLNTSHQGRA